ncbi:MULTISPECIES: IS91 family transposase [unclassified Bradyrhizobium]|uniref:IS91 family transposase n=1 Tax=unclassified Bradyrhizobium TaxID=2631580 RepID=UPI003395885E
MIRPDSRANRPAIEIADILRRHGDTYRRVHAGHLGRVERRVMSAIVACRTEALGGHMEACDDCGTTRVAYNSCRNRHCPKCQGPARAAWLAAREADLLPVPYFHVVFTLPAPIAAIAFQNKAIVYAILFKAAAEAMSTLAANPRRLGAGIGVVAVLHTWGQALTHHPHVHCVVPGGGLSPDSAPRWIASRPNFFLAVKPLVRLFRRLFLERLTAAFDAGTLNFFGDLASLAEPAAFTAHLVAMRRISWVVYAKRPFGGPAQVLAYLGRYTHRVAIANSRLVALRRGSRRLYLEGLPPERRDKDHEAQGRRVHPPLPSSHAAHGFHRIHHFGFMANRHRAAKLALCRALLDHERTAPNNIEASPVSSDPPTRAEVPPCPDCGGVMRIVERFRHSFNCSSPRTSPFQCDTS